MSRRVSGLTIAEALVTLALVFFVFALTAGLLQSYLRAVDFAGGVDKAIDAAQTALSVVRNEAAQALSVSSPAGGTSQTLTFDKVWTMAPNRLPNPNATFPAFWEPRDASWLDRVTYTVRNERLVRSSTREQTRFVLVADEIVEFQVQVLPNQNLLVEVSTREEKILRKFSTQVFLEMVR